ncbi:MAG: phosphoribosyl-ATP diphosphatase [Rhodobiaceae bacterium]|nr:phosphoribosyl-ATP diphosphatase [Rhodobiaceae bacterium]|tara:strand:- start:535 stop:825 length:291 start_codon:yes stop_codon:yes gene_type:complete
MTDKTKIIDDLWDIIKEKENSADSGSYTYDTLQKGIKRASQKLGEEASELIVAALAETKEEVINESADLIYHWLLLLRLSDVDPQEVFQELIDRKK